MFSYTFLASLLVAGACASPLELVERADTCNRDNLLRCVIDPRYTAQASAFCSDLVPFTSTVGTTTVTETATQWVDVTATTVTDVLNSVTTVYTQTIPSATVTVTEYYGKQAFKRAEDSAPAPVCMTKGVNYPASRISSACSCIGVPATTLSVTFTAGTSTVTETSTSLQTASTTVTAWETVETTFVDGVETVTVPHPALINMDFETGNLDGWIEKKGTGGPDAFTVQVVSEAGPSGNPNKAVKITNNLNQGYDYLEMNQSILAEAGAVYRISVAAKSTASNAGATIPKMTGYFWLRRQPLSLILSFSNAGIPLGNGWYKFTYDFRMPDGKSGESYLFFDFQRNASPISTFLDDITIQRL